MMVIEFARNVLGYKDANSREMDAKTPHNVIDIMEEQKTITDMGGTMRLGAYECTLKQGSRVFDRNTYRSVTATAMSSTTTIRRNMSVLACNAWDAIQRAISWR